MYPKDEWKMISNFDLIGTSYCHSRKFVADQESFKWFQSFKTAEESNFVKTHEQMFAHVNKKMKKLKLGLKSYNTLIKRLNYADKLGVSVQMKVY